MGMNDKAIECLTRAVGADHFIQDPEILRRYATDIAQPVLITPKMPAAVIRPGSLEEVLDTVKVLSDHRIPAVPRSCGLDYHGGTLPLVAEAVILDLSRMNRIVELCTTAQSGMYAVVEPGVTFEQLQSEIEPHGLRLPMPARRPAAATVLSTYASNHPTYRSSWQGNYCFPMIIPTVQLVTADGNLIETGGFHTGARTISSTGMGLDRIPYGCLGTSGMLTKATVLFEKKTAIRKIFLARFDGIEAAGEAAMRILRYSSQEIGETHVILNNVCLASLLCDSAQGLASLKNRLPAWTYALCLSGPDSDWVDIQEKHLREIAAELRIEFSNELSTARGAAQQLLDEFERPQRVGRVFGYAPHNRLEFHTVLSRIPRYDTLIRELLRQHGFHTPPGVFILPIEQARTCYVEYDLFFDPEDDRGSSRLRAALEDIYPSLIDAGAFFPRSDYPVINDGLRRAAPEHYALMDEVKAILDPHNTFNPGRIFK